MPLSTKGIVGWAVIRLAFYYCCMKRRIIALMFDLCKQYTYVIDVGKCSQILWHTHSCPYKLLSGSSRACHFADDRGTHKHSDIDDIS